MSLKPKMMLENLEDRVEVLQTRLTKPAADGVELIAATV
jgi:hypothetical protein